MVFSVFHLAQNPASQNFFTPEKLLLNSVNEQNWDNFRRKTLSPFSIFDFLKGSKCKMPGFDRRKYLIQKQNHPQALCLLKHKSPPCSGKVHSAAGVHHITRARRRLSWSRLEVIHANVQSPRAEGFSLTVGQSQGDKCNARYDRGTLCGGRRGMWLPLRQTGDLPKC